MGRVGKDGGYDNSTPPPLKIVVREIVDEDNDK